MISLARHCINAIFPKKCASCNNSAIDGEGIFCSSCWQQLKFARSGCSVCAQPFDFLVDSSDIVCASCIKESPAFDRMRFLLEFNEASSKIISRFKYYDTTYLSSPIAKILYSRYQDYINEADFIMFVPMFWIKRCFRLYNQSALLASSIAKLSNQDIYYDILLKTRWTKPQVSLKAKERRKNLPGSFAINNQHLSKIKNKKILLVDDVITTGSTINHCAKLLKKAGAASVNCLAISASIAN